MNGTPRRLNDYIATSFPAARKPLADREVIFQLEYHGPGHATRTRTPRDCASATLRHLVRQNLVTSCISGVEKPLRQTNHT